MRDRKDMAKDGADQNHPGRGRQDHERSNNIRSEDRRRSARFACGGEAKISRLPSDGIFLPGKILDLSLHGCRVDTTLPINHGVRAEIVLRVNATSFRAVGEVREIRNDAGAGIEFVQLSNSGRDVLADLVEELARLQAVMSQLRAARREMDVESFRAELKEGKLLAAKLGSRFVSRFRAPSTNLSDESSLDEVAADREVSKKHNEEQSEAPPPLVIAVDLFG